MLRSFRFLSTSQILLPTQTNVPSSTRTKASHQQRIHFPIAFPPSRLPRPLLLFYLFHSLPPFSITHPRNTFDAAQLSTTTVCNLQSASAIHGSYLYYRKSPTPLLETSHCAYSTVHKLAPPRLPIRLSLSLSSSLRLFFLLTALHLRLFSLFGWPYSASAPVAAFDHQYPWRIPSSTATPILRSSTNHLPPLGTVQSPCSTTATSVQG